MALSPQERSRRMRLNMLMAMSYAVAGRSAFTPLSLFSAGEVGAWYDPSDFSTMFQDAAGTTPVTAVEQPVGLMLDKSKSLALGANIVSNGGPFTDTTGWTVASTSGTAPSLSVVSSRLRITYAAVYTFGAANIALTTTVGQWYTVTVTAAYVSGTDSGLYLQKSDSEIAAINAVGTSANAGAARTMTLAFAATATTTYLRIINSGTANAVFDISSVSVKSIAGNHASQTTSTSRPVLRQEADGRYYLAFDGTDDFLVTGTINPGSVDKAQVFAGVRKLSDAAQGLLVEYSAHSGTGNDGAFGLSAPLNSVASTFRWQSKGTSIGFVDPVATYSAPTTRVLACTADISNDSVVMRVNGTFENSASTDQGTGNYLSYPLYIGRRGGTTLPFNGRLFGLIVRFSAANLSSENITNAETWMNRKTLAY